MMKLTSNNFQDGGEIPDEFAFGVPDAVQRVALGKNRNPHLAWSGIPPDTQSFALICHDPDVPGTGDDVNQADRVVPDSLPRTDFFHWVILDLPAHLSEINAGEFSSEVTPRGKSASQTLHNARQGINSYTGWFDGDNDMRGDYYGYDGPCPPWNDERIHRYVFTLYALNVKNLPLTGRFDGIAARAALEGHVLATAALIGRYSLNPAHRTSPL